MNCTRSLDLSSDGGNTHRKNSLGADDICGGFAEVKSPSSVGELSGMNCMMVCCGVGDGNYDKFPLSSRADSGSSHSCRSRPPSVDNVVHTTQRRYFAEVKYPSPGATATERNSACYGEEGKMDPHNYNRRPSSSSSRPNPRHAPPSRPDPRQGSAPNLPVPRKSSAPDRPDPNQCSGPRRYPRQTSCPSRLDPRQNSAPGRPDPDPRQDNAPNRPVPRKSSAPDRPDPNQCSGPRRPCPRQISCPSRLDPRQNSDPSRPDPRQGNVPNLPVLRQTSGPSWPDQRQSSNGHSRPDPRQSSNGPTRPNHRQNSSHSSPDPRQSSGPSHPDPRQNSVPIRPDQRQNNGPSRPDPRQNCNPSCSDPRQSSGPSRPNPRQSSGPSRPDTRQSSNPSRIDPPSDRNGADLSQRKAGAGAGYHNMGFKGADGNNAVMKNSERPRQNHSEPMMCVQLHPKGGKVAGGNGYLFVDERSRPHTVGPVQDDPKARGGQRNDRLPAASRARSKSRNRKASGDDVYMDRIKRMDERARQSTCQPRNYKQVPTVPRSVQMNDQQDSRGRSKSRHSEYQQPSSSRSKSQANRSHIGSGPVDLTRSRSKSRSQASSKEVQAAMVSFEDQMRTGCRRWQPRNQSRSKQRGVGRASSVRSADDIYDYLDEFDAEDWREDSPQRKSQGRQSNANFEVRSRSKSRSNQKVHTDSRSVRSADCVNIYDYLDEFDEDWRNSSSSCLPLRKDKRQGQSRGPPVECQIMGCLDASMDRTCSRSRSRTDKPPREVRAEIAPVGKERRPRSDSRSTLSGSAGSLCSGIFDYLTEFDEEGDSKNSSSDGPIECHITGYLDASSRSRADNPPREVQAEVAPVGKEMRPRQPLNDSDSHTVRSGSANSFCSEIFDYLQEFDEKAKVRSRQSSYRTRGSDKKEGAKSSIRQAHCSTPSSQLEAQLSSLNADARSKISCTNDPSFSDRTARTKSTVATEFSGDSCSSVTCIPIPTRFKE